MIEDKIYSYLRQAGCTHAGACGILGNLKGENSLFSPTRVETSYLKSLEQYGIYSGEEYAQAIDTGKYTKFTDGIGFGLAQWTYYTRKKNLLAFAQSRGTSIGDFDTQLIFIPLEMMNNYKDVWTIVSTTEDYKEATRIVCERYEKPAKVEEQVTKRTQYAKEYDEYFKDWEKPQSEECETDRCKVVKIALSQVGYLEKRTNEYLDDFTANAGTNNYTKYARDMDNIEGFYNGKKQGFAYCDLFTDWCFVQSYGVDTALDLLCQHWGSSGAGCTNSMGYYRNAKQFIRRSQGKPEVGDQIFFGNGLDNSTHTGLVVAVDDSNVYTVEGNTNDNPTVVAEGIGVFYKSYPLTKTSIIGYGRPEYNDGYEGDGFELQEDKSKEVKEEPVIEPIVVDPIIPQAESEVKVTEYSYDRRKMIDVAMSQIGYLEKRTEEYLDDFKANYGENDYNKYARDLDAIEDYYYHERKQGLPWCDIFTDWCMVQAYGAEASHYVNCQPKYSYGAGCDMSAKYYADAGRFDHTPQVGDQFFINSFTHTGIVIEVRNHSVVTVEGNQPNANGQQSVCQKVRLLNEIDGFGHPRYNDGLEGTYYWNPNRTDLQPTGEIIMPVEESEDTPVINADVEGLILDTLSQGSTNTMLITVLQTLLQYKGYSIGRTGIDGDFGSSTYQAVVQYQKDKGLTEDGICGMNTWKSLFN